MLGSDFRGLAEAVTQTYGDDPWFFLRELAQNSRDAGARHIRVNAEASAPGKETLTFADDGRGMTLAHARRFLFRLFASDKAGDPAAAGRYGIGFWTILRFQPEAIMLQSRHGDDAWAVSLDAGLNVSAAPCLLSRPGTTVVLTRPAVHSSPGEFSRRVETGLRTYCRYLRRNDRRGTMLPLWFSGKNLTEPMTLPGPLNLSFLSGPVEGAVGLGEKPEVRLFARGLPVWQGTALGQMSHLQTDADIRSEVGFGLSPVFLLNGNHLDVTFSRSLAVENRALDLLRKKAEAALQRLLAASLEATFPRKWPRRLGDRLLASLALLRRPGWHWLAPFLLLLVALEFVFLRQWFPAAGVSHPSWFSLRAAPASYRGAVVSDPSAAPPPPFSYSPAGPRLFRLFVADAYDERSGFVRQASAQRRPLPRSPHCPPSAGMGLRLRAEGGETFLPLAAGQELAPGSLRLDDRALPSPFATVQGEAVALLPAAGGLVEYRSCPGTTRPELAAADRSRFTALPAAVFLPAELEAALNAVRLAPVPERVALARALARERLEYDTSPATIAGYRRSRAEISWLSRVLRIGRGDCDVLNGFQALLLRKMEVPARLVIGLVGEGNRASPRLHAWAEYFDSGWVASDATPVSPVADPLPAGEPKPPAGPSPGPQPAAETDLLPPRLRPARVLLILLLLPAGAGLFFLARRRRRRKAGPPPGEAMKKQLLQIARQALLHPEPWGADNPLSRHRLLPTVDGDLVSLRRAQRLQGQKKLFLTANRNPLALAMSSSRMTVLDLSQPLYAPWRTLFPGAVDCDLLCRLRPEPPVPDHDLLAAVNAMRGRRQQRALPVLLAPGLSGSEWLRVSLPKPLRNAPFFFPRRFIAVAPGGKAMARATGMYAVNPPLAVIRFLRRLHEEGVLGKAAATGPLKKAARRLLRESHG
jgi:hypothetical protein